MKPNSLSFASVKQRRPEPPFAKLQASGLEVYRRLFAALGLDFVADLLTLFETVETCPLNGADMDEDVFATAIRLNEAVTFGRVEPLNRVPEAIVCILV